MMLLVKAIRFAEEAHKGQTRKISGYDYIVHPITCTYLLMKFKQESHRLEELLCAMVLHDTLEDCESVDFSKIHSEFGPLVASLVYELTNDEDEIKRIGSKHAYQSKKILGMSSWGLTLKLIDFLANSMDSPSEKRANEIEDMIKDLKRNRILTGTQLKISDAILAEVEKF